MRTTHLRPLGAALLALAALPATAQAAPPPGTAAVKRSLDAFVGAKGGPPGGIVTLYRGGDMTVLRAGRADVERPGAPRATDHMRIASVSKAFSGALTLQLVRDGRLDLDDTIAELRPDLPAAWGAVTVRQLLNHTSGVPDYTRSERFGEHASTDPQGYVSPTEVIDWVRDQPLDFEPGSRFQYSNTDNIVVGLIAEARGPGTYPGLLAQRVFKLARLSDTSFPTTELGLPSPFIHGYVVDPDEGPQDVTEFLSPSGAWASGAIISTPADLNRFVRAYVGGRFFGAAQRREQRRFVAGGQSSPPGPGTNASGLALFRYKTRCGTVYGHSGSFPGYVQFIAATADGKRAVTTSFNVPTPTGEQLDRLRELQAKAVCALTRKRR